MLVAVLAFVVGSLSMPVEDDQFGVRSVLDYDDHYGFIEFITLKIPISENADSKNGSITWKECTELCNMCGIEPKKDKDNFCVCAAIKNKESECLSESLQDVQKKGLKYEVIRQFETNDKPFDSFLKEMNRDDHLNWEELRKRMAQDNARDQRCLSLGALGSSRDSLQTILGQGLRTDLTVAERAAEFRKRIEALRSRSILGLRRAQAGAVQVPEAPQTNLPVSPFLDKPLAEETLKGIKDLVQATDGVSKDILGVPNLEGLSKKIDDALVDLIPEQSLVSAQSPPEGASLQTLSDTSASLISDIKEKLGVSDSRNVRDRILRSPNPAIFNPIMPSSLVPSPTVQSPTTKHARTFGGTVSHQLSE
uniref:MANSC domain-containing protein n=1 Tax=Graphocephala atropunctata TaxID=36148 RepID=A0A1B6MRP3_9HEMI